MQSYFKLQIRKNHQTLGNDDPVLATKVLLMFFKMYDRVLFSQDFLSFYGLDAFLSIPVSVETPEIPLSKEIQAKLVAILKKIDPRKKIPDMPEITEFMEMAGPHKEEFMKAVEKGFKDID